MKELNNGKPWEILLVEDNHGDIVLIEEALTQSGITFNLKSITNGVAAVDFLMQGNELILPDLILLDLNLPKMNGLEVLKKIKNDEKLEAIPVVILTTSESETDIYNSYKLKANSFVTKPINFEEFMGAINNIKEYWLSLVKLPSRNHFEKGS